MSEPRRAQWLAPSSPLIIYSGGFFGDASPRQYQPGRECSWWLSPFLHLVRTNDSSHPRPATHPPTPTRSRSFLPRVVVPHHWGRSITVTRPLLGGVGSRISPTSSRKVFSLKSGRCCRLPNPKARRQPRGPASSSCMPSTASRAKRLSQVAATQPT